MRPLSPMGFVLALVLHASIALLVVLWTWFQPKPKPPPAIFEMVAAPAAMEDSVETGNTSPEPVPQNLFRPGRYRPINIPKPAPLPEPEPAAEARPKTPPKDAPREKAPSKRESAKETKPTRQTLAEFKRQNQSKTTSSRNDAPRSPVKAPTIDTRETTAGLRSAMGNSSSRSRVQSLNSAERAELDQYYALLHAMLQNAWMAPPGIRGPVEVTVVFTVTPSGAITAASISGSSGYAVFDESALQVFRTITSFRPTPNGQAWTFEVPFSLRD